LQWSLTALNVTIHNVLDNTPMTAALGWSDAQ
jgi:hypothetical protein